MATLIAHYDASTLGLADGATVSSWSDLTGTQGAYTPIAGTPVYRTARQNGLGVISAPANVVMTSTWTVVPTNPCTLIIAGGLDIIQTDDPWAHQTFAFLMFTNGSVWDLSIGGSDLTGGSVDLNFHVWTLFYNGASSALKIDGVTVNTGSPGTSVATGTTGTIKGPFRHCEWYFYNGDATALGIEASLMSKWQDKTQPRRSAIRRA